MRPSDELAEGQLAAPTSTTKAALRIADACRAIRRCYSLRRKIMRRNKSSRYAIATTLPRAIIVRPHVSVEQVSDAC